MDEIPLQPIHVIFALKEKHPGKLDSQAWFFEAFAEHLKPKYSILMDVGTVPTETAMSRLMCSMDRDPKSVGVCVCGELTTTYRPNFCQVTVAAQHFEYEISNILDRSTGSVFGFIDVVPSAFNQRPEGPLVHYFQTLITSMDKLGPFLAEDRMLCFKGTMAKTDVPETIEGLNRQHHRWLNRPANSLFVAVYTVMRFSRVVNDTVRFFWEFVFFREFVFIATVLTVTWIFLSNPYLAFYFFWKGGNRNTFGDSGDDKGEEDALLFMPLMYLSFLMVHQDHVQFVIGLGNRPEYMSLVYRIFVFHFEALMMVFTLILSMSPFFSLEIWLTRDENDRDEAKEDVAEGVEGAEKKTEVQGTVSARDYGPSETILMGSGCNGTGVNIIKANEVSESSVLLKRTSVLLCLAAGMDPEIEHFIISAFKFLLRISSFIIGYAMGVSNAIHSTVTNVPEGLFLIGRTRSARCTLTAKRKRMLATNLEGVQTIECTSYTCFEMGTLTQHIIMNGIATSTCTNVFLCVLLFPHHVCKQ